MGQLSSQPLRVLIIDDHAGFGSAVRELLERRGFAVVAEADSAISGVEAAHRVLPEAVLLDVRLPDGDGFDVCQTLTESDPELAVVLVSTDEPFRSTTHLSACGARGFLLKSRLLSADLMSLLGRVRRSG